MGLNYQPHTIDPTRLLIGVSSVELDGSDLGAIINANLEIATVTKERYKGYPTQRMETITESISANMSVTVEEIGSVNVLLLLDSLFNTTNSTYSLSMYAPFAVDNTSLKLEANAQLLPELSINWSDEWCNLIFKFECIGTNIINLITRSVSNTRRPATTIDKNNLSIGKPKVLINDQSIGSIQSVVITIQGKVKKQERGYPRCVENIIYTELIYDISIQAEEQVVYGDDCNVKLQQRLVDGRAIQIQFPHCKIPEDLGINTTNEWLSYKQKILPFGDVKPILETLQ